MSDAAGAGAEPLPDVESSKAALRAALTHLPGTWPNAVQTGFRSLVDHLDGIDATSAPAILDATWRTLAATAHCFVLLEQARLLYVDRWN